MSTAAPWSVTYWPGRDNVERYAAAWDALCDLLDRTPGVTFEGAADEARRPTLVVRCANERGQGDAYTVHDLAWRYGAIAVVR
jgi:hypothetical protein